MYKVTLSDQAEVVFPSFERAFRHMKGQVYVALPARYVSDVVECGNVFYTDEGDAMEKVS
jgi:hypothetical protein